jgi:outer membrane protein TolC
MRLPIFDAGRCAPTCAARPPTSTPPSRATTAPCSKPIHETADAVASLQSIARQQAEQRSAEAAAEGAYEIAVQRYRAGLGTYLNVLAAESAVLAQRRLGVDLAARALDARVALYRALGGG